MFPPTASAAAYSFAVGTSESAVLQALRPPASTDIYTVPNGTEEGGRRRKHHLHAGWNLHYRGNKKSVIRSDAG